MQAETAVIDQGTVARDKAKLVAELETAAKTANSAAGLANTEVTAAQAAEIERLAVNFEAVRAASEAANGPLRTFAREAADTNKNLQEAAVGGLRSFEDGLVSIVNGTATAKDAFRSMANSIISDLARIAIRQSITGPLAGLLGGSLGGIFGGAGGVLPGGLPLGFGGIGHNAAGTDNWRGGLTTINERGPEIVDLPKGSRIIPNSLAKNMRGGGQTITVTIVNSPTFAPGMTGTDLAAVNGMIQQNSAQLRNQVQEDLRTAIRNDADTLTRG